MSKDRKKFEDYIASIIFDLNPDDEVNFCVELATALMLDGNGDYMSTWTSDKFDAWQAAKLISPQPSMAEPTKE